MQYTTDPIIAFSDSGSGYIWNKENQSYKLCHTTQVNIPHKNNNITAFFILVINNLIILNKERETRRQKQRLLPRLIEALPALA